MPDSLIIALFAVGGAALFPIYLYTFGVMLDAGKSLKRRLRSLRKSAA